MKQYKSFKQYLTEHNVNIFDKQNSAGQQINEAVMGQANKFWPNFSIVDILKVSSFSDDWTSNSIFGRITGRFKIADVERLESAVEAGKYVSNDELQDNKFEIKYKNRDKLEISAKGDAKIVPEPEQFVVNYQGNDWKKIDSIIKKCIAGKESDFVYDEPTVKVPTYQQPEFGFVKDLNEAVSVMTAVFKVIPNQNCKAETADDVFGKIETAVKDFGKAAKIRRVKPTGDIDLTITGSFCDLFQAFAILDWKAIAFWVHKRLATQTLNPVGAIQSVFEHQNFVDELMPRFKKCFDFTSDLGVMQKWLLNFAYGSIYKKQKKMTPADIEAVVKKAEASGHPIPAEQVEQMKLKSMSKQEVEALATKECWDNEKTKQVLSTLPNPEFKDVDEFCDYFKKNHIEQQLGNFTEIWNKQYAILNKARTDFIEKAAADGEKWVDNKKEVEARLKPIEDKVRAAWELKLQLPEVKNLWQLQGLIDWHGSVEEIAAAAGKVKEIVQVKPNHQTKGSERRMKLFYAAQHLDPKTEIIQTADWVVAVCRSAKATSPFGRLKPKVIKGTNDVDPKCNLEDWEGITPESKKWRDNPTMDESAYVRDGVDDEHGTHFDTILGEHGQTTVKNAHIFCETAWCFTGVLGGQWGWSDIHGSSDFNKYSESNTRPIMILMDTKRGALYAYAHFRYGSEELENFLNENEKCDGDPKNGSDPSDKRQKQFLDTFKSSHPSFNTLITQLNRKYYPDFNIEIDDEMGYDDYKAGEVKNAKAVSGSHPAAIRRLKLFQAAEHWGATIIKTPKWIVAVCDGNQMQPFGRYKPIASKEDPSKPDPKYNLEDWEGITPEAKKIRDRQASNLYAEYDCVKDGITDGYSISFDHLEGHSGQGPKVKYAESCWCVCGALGDGHFPWGQHDYKYSQFDSYTAGCNHKAFVCMDMQRGAMYLWAVGSHGHEEIANERDSMDSFAMSKANSASDQVDWFRKNFLPSHPELEVLINRLKKKYGGTVSQSSDVMTPEKLYKSAQEAGNVSSNGALIIHSKNDAFKYKTIFNKFSRITVDASDCEEMFKGADLTSVRQIDFTGVARNMNSAFMQAQLDIIDIIGTYNVETFYGCFQSARLEQLTGLDTSSTVSIENMFNSVTASKNGKLRLPPLNLAKCQIMDNAFSKTNIVNVKLENTDRIRSAKDCYVDCPYLVNYPPTMFKDVRGLDRLTSGKAYIDIFSGCDQLVNASLAPVRRNDKGETIKDGITFDDLLKQTEDYYAAQAKSKSDKLFDDDGYYRVDSSDSVKGEYYAKNMQKIQKIRIYTAECKNIFSGIHLYAREIDLNELKDASMLFANAIFNRSPMIVGCEQVENASSMFQCCKFAIAPNLDLPSVKKFKDIFCNCQNLHQIPKLVVGTKFEDGDYSQFDSIDYVFGHGSYQDGVVKNCGIGRLETFCRGLRKQIIGEIVIPGEKEGKNGTESFEPRTSEILQKYGSVIEFFKKLKYAEKAVTINKIIVDTNPSGMFQQQALDFLLIEFDEAVMAQHHEWQPDNMFKGADIKKLKISNWSQSFTSAKNLFYGAKIDNAIPEFDMSGIEDGFQMFYRCKAQAPLSKVPDLSHLKNGFSMFQESNILPATGFKLSELKLGDSLQNANQMFANVKCPIDVDWFVSNVTTAIRMFSHSDVTRVGIVKLLKATACDSMFYNCVKLHSITAFSGTGTASAVFSDCTELAQASYIEMQYQTDMHGMFFGCSKLTKIVWYNFNKNSISNSMFTTSPLAKLYGQHMEKYKASKYVQNVPSKIKNIFVKNAAE